MLRKLFLILLSFNLCADYVSLNSLTTQLSFLNKTYNKVIPRWKHTHTINTHVGSNPVKPIISNDNKYLIVKNSQDRVFVYDLTFNSTNPIKIFYIPLVRSVALSKDNKYLIASGSDIIKIWDFESTQLIDTINFKYSGNPIGVAISNDNSFIVSQHNTTIKLWNFEPKKGAPTEIKAFNLPNIFGEYLLITNDNKYLIIEGIISSLDNGKIIKNTETFADPALSNDNQFIVFADKFFQKKLIILKNIANDGWSVYKELANNKYIVAEISADNKYIYASDQSSIDILSFENLQKVSKIDLPSIYKITLSSNGQYLAALNGVNGELYIFQREV